MIQQVLVLAYHQWDYRNKIVHGDDGIRAKEAHKQANLSIQEQFCIRVHNLFNEDCYLIQNYTKTDLFEKDINTKQTWLSAITFTREAFTHDDKSTTSSSTQSLITDFFN